MYACHGIAGHGLQIPLHQGVRKSQYVSMAEQMFEGLISLLVETKFEW